MESRQKEAFLADELFPSGYVFVFQSFFDGGNKNETQKAKITDIEAQLRSLRSLK